jgi:hypothetical protein
MKFVDILSTLINRPIEIEYINERVVVQDVNRCTIYNYTRKTHYSETDQHREGGKGEDVLCQALGFNLVRV